MDTLVQINHVSKSYGGNQVLNQCNVTIERNRMIGIVGENGIGKSTLLKLIAGLCESESGTIEVGNVVSSYLFNREQFYTWMKVKDAVSYYQDFYDDFETSRALGLLEQSAIRLEDKISELSTGNAERLCMILALSRQVDLYLFDEPFGGVDPAFKKEVKKLLLGNMKEGASVVMVTHLLKDMETLFDQLIIMKRDGIEIVEAESIREQNKSLEQYYLEVTKHA